MAEALPEPKKHLALDTDWQTALGMVAFFFICALSGIDEAWMTLRGTFRVPGISWVTPMLLVASIYFGVVIPERPFRIAAFVFALGQGSRIALWMARASPETLLVNEIFARWIFSGLCLAGCVFVVHWFSTKITHV